MECLLPYYYYYCYYDYYYFSSHAFVPLVTGPEVRGPLPVLTTPSRLQVSLPDRGYLSLSLSESKGLHRSRPIPGRRRIVYVVEGRWHVG